MNFKTKKENTHLYFSPEKDSFNAFSQHLKEHLLKYKQPKETLILLCIGTDKITGDCLGPLVGSKLQKRNFPYPLYGTLKQPLHASNLSESLIQIKKYHPQPFLLAIDAAVGAKKNIGRISLSCNPLSPGKGVSRPLTPIGNISITGIINEASSSSELLLPYTSLYLVDSLAEYICSGIITALTI